MERQWKEKGEGGGMSGQWREGEGRGGYGSVGERFIMEGLFTLILHSTEMIPREASPQPQTSFCQLFFFLPPSPEPLWKGRRLEVIKNEWQRGEAKK